jgi:MFS family permease
MSEIAIGAPNVISEAKIKFNARIVWLIGLAVFAQEISWNFYDSQVPVSLGKYIASLGVVGAIMGLDNLIGLFIQPIIGNLSDNTRTRWGKRMPFILIGIPLAAFFFALIPFETSLPMLMILLILYVTTMEAFKAPTDALLPDTVPGEHRSKGNAIFKVITSLTIIFASLISLLIVDKNLKLAFLVPSLLMVVSWFILKWKFKEKNTDDQPRGLSEGSSGSSATGSDERVQLIPTFLNILKAPDKSALWLLISIFLINVAWSALRALLTRYGIEQIGMTRGAAGGLTLPGSIAFFLLAYPVGWLSEKYGRKLLMIIGLGVMTAGLALGFIMQTRTFLMITVTLVSIGWTALSINAIVIVWNVSGSKNNLGTYTGLYHLFASSAAVVGPAVVGFMTDLTGWNPFLLNVALFPILTFIIIRSIKLNFG